MNGFTFRSFLVSQSGQWALRSSLQHGGAQASTESHRAVGVGRDPFAVCRSRGEAINWFWLT